MILILIVTGAGKGGGSEENQLGLKKDYCSTVRQD